jgi:uncharacterized protein YbaR (Trm112 family)
MTEFPSDFLPLLRCSADGGPLSASEIRSGHIGIIQARLECDECGLAYRIEDGIARMLLEDALSPEDRHEIAIRDVEYGCTNGEAFVPPEASWRSELSDLIEIPPHLDALAPLQNQRVLELGCGDGRYTMLMAQLGARVMAADFSLNALRRMAAWLPSGTPPTSYRARGIRQGDLRPYIALVQVDASRFRVQARAFDRALSATPLDSREQRMAMFRTIADALTDAGRYLGGFEHDDFIRRLLGLPLVRRYQRGGIFIEHFDRSTIKSEFAPYFLRLSTRCVRPRIPFVSRLPKSWAAGLLGLISMTPGLGQLGEIVLVSAERSVRPPAEGANRAGNRFVKAAFKWYARRLGKEPVWGSDEYVT